MDKLTRPVAVFAAIVSLWLVLVMGATQATFRPDAWYLPDDDLLGFVEVPPGPFEMGDDADRHTLDLPRFFIGRFEVTVGQFRTFVEDDGYAPEDARSVQGASDHPVRRISWHAAMAYGVWLTRTLHTWSGTPQPLADRLRGSHERSPWRVTLPSEAEWEKAARGAHGRIYPWGDAPPAPDLANYPDAGLRTTAPVGSFPRGASPYGVLDMSGNVWEWTRSLYRDYPYDASDGRESPDSPRLRVLRGGSFLYRPHNLQAARRMGDMPDLRMSDYGFRVVITPRAQP